MFSEEGVRAPQQLLLEAIELGRVLEPGRVRLRRVNLEDEIQHQLDGRALARRRRGAARRLGLLSLLSRLL